MSQRATGRLPFGFARSVRVECLSTDSATSDFHKLAADKPATPTSDVHCEYDHEALASWSSAGASFEFSAAETGSPSTSRNFEERPELFSSTEGNREKNESSDCVSFVETAGLIVG